MLNFRGFYIGADDDLKGQHAMLRIRQKRLEAQFDDHATGLGYGWHPYPAEHFAIYEIANDGSEHDLNIKGFR